MKLSTLLNANWEFIESKRETLPLMTQAGKPGWLPAQVPGYVHLDLIRQGIINNPFYEMHEAGCQWVDHSDWKYRTIFVHRPEPSHTEHFLTFHGLDTICTISLNGEIIAKHDNAFLPCEINVTHVIKTGENELVVEFHSAFVTGENRRKEYFAQHGLKDPTANFDERSFVRKPQYMFGWDWGPRLVSCGIFAPVELTSKTNEPEIENIEIKQSHLPNGSVKLNFLVRLSKPTQSHFLEASMSDDTHFEELELKSSDQQNFSAELTIEEPELWSPLVPNPHLYDLCVDLYRSDDTKIDQHESQFGLKTIRLIQEPDEFGESFEFELNGSPIYVMGANWIPDHSFPGIITRKQTFEKVQAAKDMGMNMLRIWGGGLMESEDLYDACDQIGMLVWQDFPYACAYYPDDEIHQKVACEEASFHIKRLRNRASLALWCGNNENHTMFDDKWGGVENNPSRHFGENLYHCALSDACESLDPAHPYLPSSPYGKNQEFVDENQNRFTHNMGFVGDSHYWDVWHGRGDWVHYKDSTARFSSEFGFASAPSIEVLEEFISPRQWEPFSPQLNWHNKTRKPIETFMEMVYLHYPVVQTVEDLVYFTQLNQRDALRFGIEHWRRSGFCKGTLIWQLNDCWPVQSWALMDCFSHWKAAAFELRRIYNPVLISIQKSDQKVEVFATVQNTDSHHLKLSIKVTNLKSGVCEEVISVPQFFAENGKTVLAQSLAIDKYDAATTLISVHQSYTDELVAWQLLGEPKDIEATCPEINFSVVDEHQILLKINGPVVDLWLSEPENGTQFGHNFITVESESEMIIETDGPVETLVARSIAGHHLVIQTGPIL